MKLKLLARRMSVSAPRMTVRRHVPWPLRVVSVVAAVSIGAGGALWLWNTLVDDPIAERRALAEEVARIRGELGGETAERQRLLALTNAAESRLKVEQTAAERLADQVRTLEGENARLKADLAYMESLLPAGESEGMIAIRRFEVLRDADSQQLRYRALLLQGGRLERDFEGSFQVLVSTEADGRRATLAVPAQGSPAAAGIRLSFRRYKRVEGLFAVPIGATIRSVQLRVLEGTALRAQQTVTF